MPQTQPVRYPKAFNAVTVTGNNGKAFFARDFRICDLIVRGGGNGTFTIRVQGAIGENPPDFTQASSTTNQWSFVQLVNTDTGATIAGSTGYVQSGTDATVGLEANINRMDWIAIQATMTSGNVTIDLAMYDNR